MLLSTALRLRPHSGRPAVIAFVGAGGKSSALFSLADELVAAGQRVVITTTTHMAAAQAARAGASLTVRADIPWSTLSAALDRDGQALLIGAESVRSGAVEKRSGLAPARITALVERAAALNIGAVLVEADGSHMLPAKAPAAHEPALPAVTTLLVPVLGLDAVGRRIAPAVLHRPERMRTLLGLPATDRGERLTPAFAAKLLLHPEGGLKLRPESARVVCLLNKADTAPRLAAGRLIAAECAAQDRVALLTTLNRADGQPVRSRHGPVGIILLAAGASTRMGRAKQLLEIEGVPLVVRAVRTAMAGGAAHVIVVTGGHGEATTACLNDSGWPAHGSVTLRFNPQWQAGQATSVKAGLAALTAVAPAAQAAIFMPIDQPFVPSTLLRRLIAAWAAGAQLAAPLVDSDMRGAPALFDQILWPELNALEGDVGGRLLLRRHASVAVGVPIAGAFLRDLDRPEDLAL